jgi:hypothetical protein
MLSHEDVEWKTLDGLTIRGWLYPASKRGPGIIITPGVGKTLPAPLRESILAINRFSHP